MGVRRKKKKRKLAGGRRGRYTSRRSLAKAPVARKGAERRGNSRAWAWEAREGLLPAHSLGYSMEMCGIR
jgi:hypothetical protein